MKIVFHSRRIDSVVKTIEGANLVSEKLWEKNSIDTRILTNNEMGSRWSVIKCDGSPNARKKGLCYQEKRGFYWRSGHG